MMVVIRTLFLCHIVSAAFHSLKYFYTASTGIPNLPEFVVVGLVDEVQIIHYDSNTRRTEPKQDWMNKVTLDDSQYWENETAVLISTQEVFKDNTETAKQRFNQTGGVHIVQVMYGCDWDDDTGQVYGFHQHSYDGEDFISFDMKTMTWIAAKPQAVITKNKWDHDSGWITQTHQYLSHECVDWLKKYLKDGKNVLLRTDLPSVSLLQKTPSSPVSCHATGFYPDRASMFWRKDGEEVHEEVDHGEILPNHDGTFQMNVDLNISSVKPEDWSRYDCVFQLYGAEDDIITKLGKAEIKSSEADFTGMIVIIIIIPLTVVAVCIFTVTRSIAFIKKVKNRQQLHKSRSQLDVFM